MLTDTRKKQHTVDWAETLTGEGLMFGLLGKALYLIPEDEWLQPLVDGELFSHSPFAAEQPYVVKGLALLDDWSRSFGDESLKELKVDHTHLFTGMFKIPVAPWESVYFSDERMVFQQQTLDVRAWYRRFGLETIEYRKEPDDHIGLELAFIAHLARLGLAAQEAGNTERLDEILEAQRGFLSEHLLRWGPLWCSLVEEHAQTDFYRGLALVLRGALLEIAEILNVRVPDIPGS
jgi:TorA maturation chaperone TorD